MLRPVFLSAAILSLTVPAVAQRSRPYTEGVVRFVSYIRTKPGKFDEYMKYLQGPYKTLNEALKKEGIIVGYAVYVSAPRNPEDWNIVLTVDYRNMAALDGLQDRTDPISERLLGSQEQQSQQTIERGAMRDILGSRLLRELQLK
jgi:L-rhamnose mutarotase